MSGGDSQTPPSLDALLARLGERAALRLEIETVSAAARPLRDESFLVGGVVRDLLLGRETKDLDIVVAGPVEPLAEALGAALGGRVQTYPGFLTATLTGSAGGFVIDLVQARRESYPVPGRMPKVEPGTLVQDLFRRDFTVNALAVSLSHPGRPMVDRFGGRADLAAGLLRTLHPESFADDPTRILRGARLAASLGFSFHLETERQSAGPEVARAFARVSGGRLWRELVRTLTTPVESRFAIEILARMGVAAALSPGWDGAPDAELEKRLAAASSLADRLAGSGDSGVAASCYLGAWVAPLERTRRDELARRLDLPDRLARFVISGADAAGRPVG